MYAVCFIFGAIVGSFLNVCISRIPRGDSIVTPRSRCPACLSPIAWYDNIPVISYLFLKGRCRECHASISPRYPLVELVSALGAVAVGVKFGLGLSGLAAFLFLAVLIVVSGIDLEHRIIPHVITLAGIPVFLLGGVLAMGVRLSDAIVGLATGIAVIYLVAVYYEAITGSEGMGGGDVNFLGLIGAFFGWQSLPIVLFSASFIGACVGVVLVLTKGGGLKQAIPFGPFLSLGGVIYLFFGQELWGFFLTT